LKNKKNRKYPVSVGGQALMEGILMRGPAGSYVSLRLPDGSIETYEKKIKPLKERFKPFGWPMIRGIAGFIESLVFGYRCLMESAEKTMPDIKDHQENESKIDRWLTDHFGEKMLSAIGLISGILGFALAFALFYWLPSFLFDTVNNAAGGVIDCKWRALAEGGVRVVIFVAYMFLVSKMKDVKRLFMYHGAEHKAIFCFENGEELTVEHIRKHKRFHPRCGTSFIFVMIIISILLSSILALLFPALTGIRPLWIFVKLCLAPLIIGLGYEFIRYAGRHNNILVKIFAAPGLWMQRITTAEPSDDIIEVAAEALKAALNGLKQPPPAAETEAPETVPPENIP